ncbi:MAG: 23S rRNA (pseudouridine(1915)-N(3))-methyltransferase RlmH [Deltaproteobacteria bacterium]|nr:23S rRNA (pseudouridine(1915)-N(3))-methyltransferase RlmH [Deltaproteobacteria bacterium]
MVDRTRSPFLANGESLYLKRLRRYAQMEWIEVRPARIKKGRSEEEILLMEGQAIIKKIGNRGYLVTLDRNGREYDSERLAEWLNQTSIHHPGGITFVIGGPLGLSKEILERADMILSLSKLTLTHEMSRLFLLEQIYRAFTILEGHQYHR